MTNIFANHAPSYYAAGLSVIPLKPAEKRPIPGGWEVFSTSPVSPELQANWIDRFPNSNMGLVLGPQSDICIIDIDTDNQVIQSLLAKILPPTSWERRGKKGYALAYRYSGFKTFRIKDSTGKMIVECLSSGTQIVLPPSIHPETRKPYEADTDLFDPQVLGSLHKLLPDTEAIIRAALEEEGFKLSLSGHTKITEYVSTGSRDVKMISVAGLFAMGVLRSEHSFLEGCNLLRAWKNSRVEAIAGDDIDIEKGIQRLAEFLIRDVTGPKKKPLPEGWDLGLDDADRTMFGFDVFTEKNTIWSFDQMVSYTRAEVELTMPNTKGRRDMVDFVLERMIYAGLDAKDESSLLRYVARVSDCNYTEAKLAKSLRQLRQEGKEGENQTEIAKGMIDEMTATSGHDIAFTGGEFWQWEGSHWANVPRAAILKNIAENYGHLPAAKRHNEHKGVLEIMAAIVRRESLRETTDAGINFANGYLTEHLELRAHDPIYGATYTLPYRYMPEAKHPMFDNMLHESWGDDDDFTDKVAALQEAIAVTMFGIASQFELVFLLHGPPQSGKSQMLKIVENLVPGEACSAIAPHEWADKFLPAQLYGKLLNVAGELTEDKKIDGRMFKTITSGETITGQHKQGQPFRFQPYCAHWFGSNHIPKTNDTSGGFTRRWLVLCYNRKVEDKAKVLNLGLKVAIAEREAIVSWAAQAIPRLMETRTFTKPRSHRERIEEVAKANNFLRTFLLDSGKVLLGSFAGSSSIPIPEDKLYSAYYTFALSAGDAKPVSMPLFRQRMRELGSELGFLIRVSNNARGGQDCLYEKITLATSNVVALRA